MQLAKKHFPQLQLLVRTRNRVDAYEHLDLGVDHFYRESLESSLKMGVDALNMLGYRRYGLQRAAQRFLREDERSLRKLAQDRHNKKQYIRRVREEIEWTERVLEADRQKPSTSTDPAWDSGEMRKAAQQKS